MPASRVTEEFDVVCVGSANLDTIVAVDHVPVDDERLTSTSFVTAGGGPAATAAVALSRLGVRVAMCGVVGDDAAGEKVRESLESEHVDTRYLRTDSYATTPTAVILASGSTGGRSIVTTVAPSPRVDDIPIGISRWIHVDQTGYASAHRAIQRADDDALLSVDAGNPIRGLKLAGVELYAPTVSALRARYPGLDLAAACRAAIDEGARHVVATAGSDGTWVAMPDGIEKVRSFAVDVVSTLGAGDVFHGALLAGLVRDLPLDEAVLQANWAAAVACTALDGRSGIPTLEQLQVFLAPDSQVGRVG
jgi:sugar/nucleoside kinase (ribokinase family)